MAEFYEGSKLNFELFDNSEYSKTITQNMGKKQTKSKSKKPKSPKSPKKHNMEPAKSQRSNTSKTITSENIPYLSAYNSSNLSPSQIEEIQAFRLEKIRQYKETLEKCLNFSSISNDNLCPYVISKREKLKLFNQRADEKRKSILENNYQEEIKRLKQSHSLMISNMYFKLSKTKEKIKKRAITKEKIEKSKILKEKQKESIDKKQKLIENIKNFYNDKINILKDKIKEEKTQNDLIKGEQKRVIALIEREQKNIRSR